MFTPFIGQYKSIIQQLIRVIHLNVLFSKRNLNQLQHNITFL